MSFGVSNNVNSAILSGTIGLRNVSDGITQASLNIAQRNAQAKDPSELLADAATQQIGSIKQILPQPASNLTNDLVSLSINSINAQASAKVLDVANNTVGKIIDELA